MRAGAERMPILSDHLKHALTSNSTFDSEDSELSAHTLRGLGKLYEKLMEFVDSIARALNGA